MRVRLTAAASAGRVRGLSALLVVLLAAAGCGAGPSAATSAATGPGTFAFTGTTLDGQTFDAAAMAGKPAVLWFWAPWCATCFGQAPSVAEEATEHTGKVNFLGVAGLGKQPEMAEFVRDGEVGNVTHLNDEAGEIWRKFGITEQSHFVMIDRTGAVVHKGWLDSQTLSKWVDHIVRT